MVTDSDTAFFAFVGNYLTVDDYVPEDLMPGGLQNSIDQLAASGPINSHLRNIVAINELSKRCEGLAHLTNEFREALDARLKLRFDAAMRAPTGGLGRFLLAPQPLLYAIRWLLGRDPKPATEGVPDANIFESVLLVHALAATLDSSNGIDESESEDEQKRLTLALMNLGSLNHDEDVYSSIDRTVRLWYDYGYLAAEWFDVDAAELFQDVTGADVKDVLAIGFCLYAFMENWEMGKPLLLNRVSPTMPKDLVDRVLPLIARNLADHQGSLGEPVSPFDFLAVEAHPVVAEPEGLLVLDKDVLWALCTSGLYWLAHDGIKDKRGKKQRHQWTIAYAKMVENMVEDGLRPLAPPVLDGSKSLYTEEDLERAYGQVSRCDLVIDFGDVFLLVEIVSGQLTVQTRVHSDLEKLETDFDKLVFEKCKQLDSTARKLLEDESLLTGVAKGTRSPRIIPALVIGGGFGVNPLSIFHVRERLKVRQLLDNVRIAHLCILDLSDVEILEALGERGHSPSRLLDGWQSSDLYGAPLRNHLILEGLLVDNPRPARMSATIDATYAEIKSRLGIPVNPDS